MNDTNEADLFHTDLGETSKLVGVINAVGHLFECQCCSRISAEGGQQDESLGADHF